LPRPRESERQIQSSTGINVLEWPYDSNIRKHASLTGVRMFEPGHSYRAPNVGAVYVAPSRLRD